MPACGKKAYPAARCVLHVAEGPGTTHGVHRHSGKQHGQWLPPHLNYIININSQPKYFPFKDKLAIHNDVGKNDKFLMSYRTFSPILKGFYREYHDKI